MGSKLHWPVQPIQPIVPFPVVNLWPNQVFSDKRKYNMNLPPHSQPTCVCRRPSNRRRRRCRWSSAPRNTCRRGWGSRLGVDHWKFRLLSGRTNVLAPAIQIKCGYGCKSLKYIILRTPTRIFAPIFSAGFLEVGVGVRKEWYAHQNWWKHFLGLRPRKYLHQFWCA